MELQAKEPKVLRLGELLLGLPEDHQTVLGNASDAHRSLALKQLEEPTVLLPKELTNLALGRDHQKVPDSAADPRDSRWCPLFGEQHEDQVEPRLSQYQLGHHIHPRTHPAPRHFRPN